MLEDRLTPATWDGGSSGDWDVAANWDDDEVPLPTEAVVIPGGVSVTLRPGTTQVSLIQAGAGLRLSGGTLIVEDGIQVNEFTLGGVGPVVIASDAVVHCGAFSASGAALEVYGELFSTGSVVASDHQEDTTDLLIGESGILRSPLAPDIDVVAPRIVNLGTMDVASVQCARLTNTGALTNGGGLTAAEVSGDTFTNTGDATLVYDPDLGETMWYFAAGGSNSGIIVGDEGTRLSGYGAFANEGTIRLDKGQFEFDTVENTGEIRATRIGAVSLANSGSVLLDTVNDPLADQYLYVGESYTQSAGVTDLGYGLFQAGTFGDFGQLNLTGGVLTTAAHVSEFGGYNVVAHVVNDGGTIRPGGEGGAGRVGISGSFLQAGAGRLEIDLLGTTEALYDRLELFDTGTGTTSTAALGGQLVVLDQGLPAGGVPVLRVVDTANNMPGTVTGEFDSVTIPDRFRLAVTDNSVRLIPPMQVTALEQGTPTDTRFGTYLTGLPAVIEFTAEIADSDATVGRVAMKIGTTTYPAVPDPFVDLWRAYVPVHKLRPGDHKFTMTAYDRPEGGTKVDTYHGTIVMAAPALTLTADVQSVEVFGTPPEEIVTPVGPPVPVQHARLLAGVEGPKSFRVALQGLDWPALYLPRLAVTVAEAKADGKEVGRGYFLGGEFTNGDALVTLSDGVLLKDVNPTGGDYVFRLRSFDFNGKLLKPVDTASPTLTTVKVPKWMSPLTERTYDPATAEYTIAGSFLDVDTAAVANNFFKMPAKLTPKPKVPGQSPPIAQVTDAWLGADRTTGLKASAALEVTVPLDVDEDIVWEGQFEARATVLGEEVFRVDPIQFPGAGPVTIDLTINRGTLDLDGGLVGFQKAGQTAEIPLFDGPLLKTTVFEVDADLAARINYNFGLTLGLKKGGKFDPATSGFTFDVTTTVTGALIPKFDLNLPGPVKQALKKALDVYTATNPLTHLLGFVTDALDDLGLLPSLAVRAEVDGRVRTHGRIGFAGGPLAGKFLPNNPKPKTAEFNADYEIGVPRATLNFEWLGQSYEVADLSYFTDQMRISGTHKKVLG